MFVTVRLEFLFLDMTLTCIMIVRLCGFYLLCVKEALVS